MTKIINAVVIGASGYTGAELVRLLHGHPDVAISALVADSNAGKTISAIYPHFTGLDLPDLVKLDQVSWDGVDVAFGCLPHATSQEVIANIPENVKVVDLSADFRITDADAYAEWYGKPHTQPDLQAEAVYGLTEINREQIKDARLVACPGCYPTSALLPLIPLLKEGVIATEGIIIDSKSGISGAGRSAKAENLFAELNENVKAYGIGGHRHVAEMEQELGLAAGGDIQVTFTPQVVPMNRGILSVIYAKVQDDKNATDAKKALQNTYGDEPFVQVLADDTAPTTASVTGSNFAAINVFDDRIPGQIIIVSVIDNLIKGASGQAVQNMNLMFGLAETTGLEQVAVFP